MISLPKLDEFDLIAPTIPATVTHSTKRATASALGHLLRTTEANYGNLWVRLVPHMHEHLGQVIAYSRANEIVPPWSR